MRDRGKYHINELIVTMALKNNSLKNITISINLELLESERIKHGYALSDISRIMGYKTPSGYWLLEHGSRKITAQALYKLAQLYSRSMEDFIIEE